MFFDIRGNFLISVFEIKSIFRRCVRLNQDAQLVACLTEEPELPGSLPGPATYFRGNRS